MWYFIRIAVFSSKNNESVEFFQLHYTRFRFHYESVLYRQVLPVDENKIVLMKNVIIYIRMRFISESTR